MPANGNFIIETTQAISDLQVLDLLCCGFEGHITYWCAGVSVEQLPDGTTMDDFRQGGSMQTKGNYFHWMQLVPVCGGVLRITTWDEDEDGNQISYLLGREQLALGLERMSQHCEYQWRTFLSENADADTGDAFIQCCLFEGGPIYG